MIVYRYGCLKPTHGFDGLLDQMRAANRYRNNLVELHRWRRIAEAHGVERDRTKALWSEMTRWLRSKAGIGWGTYQAIEADVKRAISKERSVLVYETATRLPRFWGSSVVRFKRFDGTGRIGANIQACTGYTREKALSGGAQFSLSIPWGKGVAKLNTGKGVVSLPCKIHRPLPDAHIVRAMIVVERIGTRYVYSVHVTMRHTNEPRQFGNGQASLNFGWRRVPGGVRVAYVVDSDGEHDELVLPETMISKFKHAESLRGLADEKASAYLGDAKKRARSRREALRGAENRELGKQPGPFVSDEHWARRDRHLYQWERDEYAKCLRQRREIYRLWARSLAGRYGEVTVEAFSMAKLSERDCDIPSARHVRFLAAPGYLREEIKSVFGKDRVTLLKAKKGETMSARCPECGYENTFDRSRSLTFRCERGCGEFDQDAANCRNQRKAIAAE